jgi:hypothetical protein
MRTSLGVGCLLVAVSALACGGGDDATAATPEGAGASAGGSSAQAGTSASSGGSSGLAGAAGASTGASGKGGSAAGGVVGSGGTGGGAAGGSGGNGGNGGKAGGASGGGGKAGGAGSGGKAGGASGSGGSGGKAGGASGSGGSSGAGQGGSASGGSAGKGGGTGLFVHPGVLVQQGQLDFVKAKITAATAPWKPAFDKAKSDSHGSLSYKAQPRADVDCGSFSMPDNGCTEEKNDVAAAYTHALLWYFTGNDAYAKKSIEIMNAWSSTVKQHTNSNAPLQSAWTASVWPRAAEIMRYTYSGWAPADVAAFETMLKTVYLPEVQNGAPKTNGNWELSMIEASIGIGVFLDDKAIFDKAVAMWKSRVPEYVYLKSDGALPAAPTGISGMSAIVNYWQGQSTFVDGLSQETCRDLGHTQLGLAAMTNAAETALIQGVDLYSLEQKRITAAYEFHSDYLNGQAVPAWLCGGSLMQSTPTHMWEIGYNAYAGRHGVTLPQTQKVVAAVRPTGINHMMVWETLTHAEVGAAGLLAARRFLLHFARGSRTIDP